MNQEAVLELVERKVRHSSQRALAREWQCSVAYINQVIQRQRPPGPVILNALGLERVVDYRRKKGNGRGG